MREDIIHIGAEKLHYDIHGMAEVAFELHRLGCKIFFENIGDPVNKGQKLPLWLKKIIQNAVKCDATYGYCPTKGILETRQYLAEQVSKQGKVTLHPDDILFVNGLGDAVGKIFGFLNRTARVLMPSPGHMTFTAAEAAHAGAPPATYALDPLCDWYPDLKDIENRIRYNPAVAGILIINPDNPTGMVWPLELLQGVVKLAQKYNLFIICDEVYQNIIYNGKTCVSLTELIEDVPAIVMRSISKEMPWPGARCGWLEFYNADNDKDFQKYKDSIINSKMLEVCSTTLPQKVLPDILQHPEYKPFLAKRVALYENNANHIYESFKDIEEVMINRSNGSFYSTIVFNNNAISHDQTLPIDNIPARSYIEKLTSTHLADDKRFAYYLLGATGVCVVPLSSFTTELQGFRITLLETDIEKFSSAITTVKSAALQYLA
jgi:aspartate/methionine/tyrosine aminotransferase